MNLFMIGARIRKREKAQTRQTNRFGFLISLTCENSDRSTSIPSTGVASTHRRMSIPMECSRISTIRVCPAHSTIVVGRDIECDSSKFGDWLLTELKSKRLSRRCPSMTKRRGAADIAKAMNVIEVRKVDGVFCCLLWMPGKADASALQ